MDLVFPGHHGAEGRTEAAPTSAEELERERVSNAIRTDFILLAEIMAITLAAVSSSPLWMQTLVLALVGLGMTLLVYGAVAVIVKADDAGVALARSGAGVLRLAGRAIVLGMPVFLKILSPVGMVAMLWVGGGILIHGLHELGVHGPEKAVYQAAEVFAGILPALHGFLAWLGQAGIAAVLGVLVGAMVDPLVKHLLQPLVARFAKKAD